MVRKTADFGFERIRRSGLQQNLKNRQIQMIAIGGSIGTGLFVGSGTALDLSGPGSFILCDSLASTTILISIQALSELMASPFVIAVRDAGITLFPSVINAAILVALLLFANSFVFAASRTFVTLTYQGFVPQIFGYIDKTGWSLIGITSSMIVALLEFREATPHQAEVFFQDDGTIRIIITICVDVYLLGTCKVPKCIGLEK
ncbi:hypothetical protein CAS74_004457 [Pichia kudriavzevii]|uniref:Amino acid permease/ SLC12A domain-containing protein n=1 Tax=Pichia kudriavzevii TaxID=4909 RepID=A0A1Z8JJP1_PICKU|nr:hypothetical protein CAS74_004457 [Pichia kudriavzevii]